MSNRRLEPSHLAHRHIDDHHVAEIPLSAMSQSAVVRIGAMAVALAFLWFAVAWAVSLP